MRNLKAISIKAQLLFFASSDVLITDLDRYDSQVSGTESYFRIRR